MAFDTRSGFDREKSVYWTGILMVAAAFVLLLLVVFTPRNDTMPSPDTTNAGPTTAQPVQPTPLPKLEP